MGVGVCLCVCVGGCGFGCVCGCGCGCGCELCVHAYLLSALPLTQTSCDIVPLSPCYSAPCSFQSSIPIVVFFCAQVEVLNVMTSEKCSFFYNGWLATNEPPYKLEVMCGFVCVVAYSGVGNQHNLSCKSGLLIILVECSVSVSRCKSVSCPMKEKVHFCYFVSRDCNPDITHNWTSAGDQISNH